MRGSSNSNTGGVRYLNFMSGQFVQRVNEGTTDAEPRELEKGPNKGKIVHELKFDTYEGQILGMETEASEYGQRLHIFMDISTPQQADTTAKISLPLSSSAAKGLLSRLPIINLSEDVVLKGYNIENKETGRFGSYLVPYQNGEKLAPQFTREVPNGLPAMKKVKIKGVEQWDDSDQLEFFENLIKNTKFEKASENEATDSEEIEVAF
jgi:hypothetical protein